MKIIILLGGNIGDTITLFKKAVALFKEYNYSLTKQSSLFRSEAWGYVSSHPYLNQVLVLTYEGEVDNILHDCLAIELELGRIRNDEQGYSDRPIDIDILYINQLIIQNEQLTLPHPRLHLRRFTLAPLAEIEPDFIHPIFKKDHKSLLLLCEDSSKVETIDQ
jgi:2-amino-4-hydroxy-6-hydroxymethyldihydropteridine diphosphokinase